MAGEFFRSHLGSLRQDIWVLNVFYTGYVILLKVILNSLSASHIHEDAPNRAEGFSRFLGYFFLIGFHGSIRTASCRKNIWPLKSNKSTIVQLLKLQSNIVVNFFTYSSTENTLNIQNLKEMTLYR